ncbi:hypothetical protein RYA05_01415 [Pseudomonas syringae pv. actinidiae]|nr:hypothetical protein [Pseudomonas syringae pv. actinidiae]
MKKIILVLASLLSLPALADLNIPEGKDVYIYTCHRSQELDCSVGNWNSNKTLPLIAAIRHDTGNTGITILDMAYNGTSSFEVTYVADYPPAKPPKLNP